MIVVNAIIGILTVVKISGFSTDNLIAGFYGIGITYYQMITSLADRMFKWFVDLLYYKVVPNVPGNATSPSQGGWFSGGPTGKLPPAPSHDGWFSGGPIDKQALNPSNYNTPSDLGWGRKDYTGYVAPKSETSYWTWALYAGGILLSLGATYLGYKIIADPTIVKTWVTAIKDVFFTNNNNNNSNPTVNVTPPSDPGAPVDRAEVLGTGDGQEAASIISKIGSKFAGFSRSAGRALNPYNWVTPEDERVKNFNSFLKAQQDGKTYSNKFYPFTPNNPHDTYLHKIRLALVGERETETTARLELIQRYYDLMEEGEGKKINRSPSPTNFSPQIAPIELGPGPSAGPSRLAPEALRTADYSSVDPSLAASPLVQVGIGTPSPNRTLANLPGSPNRIGLTFWEDVSAAQTQAKLNRIHALDSALPLDSPEVKQAESITQEWATHTSPKAASPSTPSSLDSPTTHKGKEKEVETQATLLADRLQSSVPTITKVNEVTGKGLSAAIDKIKSIKSENPTVSGYIENFLNTGFDNRGRVNVKQAKVLLQNLNETLGIQTPTQANNVEVPAGLLDRAAELHGRTGDASLKKALNSVKKKPTQENIDTLAKITEFLSNVENARQEATPADAGKPTTREARLAELRVASKTLRSGSEFEGHVPYIPWTSPNPMREEFIPESLRSSTISQGWKLRVTGIWKYFMVNEMVEEALNLQDLIDHVAQTGDTSIFQKYVYDFEKDKVATN